MRRNLLWGIAWGAFVGAIFSVMAGIVVGVRGGLPEHAPPLHTLLSVYPVAGLIGGAIIGLLRPWLTSELRVLIISPLVIFPAGVGFLIITEGAMRTWDGATWFAAIAGSIILGMIGGHQFWKAAQFRIPESREDENRRTKV